MRQKPVAILGAFFVDLACRTSRMPGWGETLHGSDFASGPGGKGSNQAIAAARQGAEVFLITRIGQDGFGEMARRLYHDEGIDAKAVVVDTAFPTGTATIIVDEVHGENAIIIVAGACGRISKSDIDDAADGIAAASYFVSQLELPLEVCLHGIAVAVRNKVPVILNPAPAMLLPRDIYPSIDYLTPNETEAGALVGFPIASVEDARRAARILRDWGVRNVLITLGGAGVFVCGETFEGAVPAFPVDHVVDTTGAGDAFNGGFAAALAEGMGLQEATRFGCAVASISVTRVGTAPSMPRRAEVNALLGL